MTRIIPAKRYDIQQLSSPMSDSEAAIDEYGQFWKGMTNGKAPVQLFDDFIGDAIQDPWRGAAGTAGTAPAILAGGINGRARLAMGNDAAVNMAANGSQLDAGAVNFRADQGGLVIEAGIVVDVVTSVAIFVGFTDQVAALEMPFTLGASDALTSGATDGVGLLFDTAADTDTIWGVGVANDVDATKQNSGLALAAATMRILRTEVRPDGSARFFVDGKLVSSTWMTGAVRPTIALTPVVAGFSRTTTARLLDVDYIRVLSARN